MYDQKKLIGGDMNSIYDLLISGADIFDGTGNPRFKGDVAVIGDRIVKVGDLKGLKASRHIDATGLALSPGFIDAHTHDDRLLLSNPGMEPKVSQGVTTIIGGNCGVSLAPMKKPFADKVTPPLNLLDSKGDWFSFKSFADYLQALRDQPAATNSAMLVGHTTLRVNAMKQLDRSASSDEIATMQGMVQEALEAGAIGLSTGLFYEPAAAATTEEVIAICEPLARHDGVYCTHMRNEGDQVLESLIETFRIGRESNVPVIISHHKVIGKQNFGRSTETLAMIESEMKKQAICLDCYPYPASSTVLSATRARQAMRVTVTWSDSLPQYAGMDLADIIKDMGVSIEEAVARLVPAGAIYYAMDEQDVQRIMKFSPTMIGSDGLPHDAAPHPRLWGTFPRVLGHYSRSMGLFSMETAIHKMTGLTAKNFGLKDRGIIQEGAYADLTLFNAAQIDSMATFDNPIAPAKGIHSVFVNGVEVWENGRSTGLRPGRVLTHKQEG